MSLYQEVQIRSKSAIIYSGYAKHTGSTIGQSAQAIEARLIENERLRSLPGQQLRIDKPAFLKAKTYSGTVTSGAKKRITRAVSLLIQSTKKRTIYNDVICKHHTFQLSFITLTVPSVKRLLSAKEAHKLLLEPFLLWLRRSHQMKSYVWKAENQLRGQIHYHITSDVFVNLTALRDKWNELQQKHGLLDEYHAKYGHMNPNSTDVHSVRKVRNMEAYLVKYMSKPNNRSKVLDRWIKMYGKRVSKGQNFSRLPNNYFNHIYSSRTQGKVWDCSLNLKKAKFYSTALTWEIESTIKHLQGRGLCEVYRDDYFAVVVFKTHKASYILPEYSFGEYKDHIEKIRHG